MTQPTSSERPARDMAAYSGSNGQPSVAPPAAAEPAALPPSEQERPTLSHIPTVAGGMPAIVSSMRHVLGRQVVRGTRELLLS